MVSQYYYSNIAMLLVSSTHGEKNNHHCALRSFFQAGHFFSACNACVRVGAGRCGQPRSGDSSRLRRMVAISGRGHRASTPRPPTATPPPPLRRPPSIATAATAPRLAAAAPPLPAAMTPPPPPRVTPALQLLLLRVVVAMNGETSVEGGANDGVPRSAGAPAGESTTVPRILTARSEGRISHAIGARRRIATASLGTLAVGGCCRFVFGASLRLPLCMCFLNKFMYLLFLI